MSLFNDIKYASMLSPYLPLFRKKGDTTWIFRCVLCGDSKKNPNKCRGSIYRPSNKNYLSFKCHNCGISSSLSNFLETVAPQLFKDYLFDNYKEKNENTPIPTNNKKTEPLPQLFQEMELSDAVLDTLQRIDQLPPTHPAVQYVIKRKIPKEHYNLLYFTTKFKRYVNSIIPNKFSSVDDDHPRLIIPFFNKHGKCFAFQGRSFGNEQPKYITIKIDPDAERLYGLERINWAKTVYVVEGPIDSLFVPNCIAVAGSSYDSLTLESVKHNCVIVPDNNPRNSEVCKLINKMINKDYKVCLWPETWTFGDINDAIKDGGLTKDEVLSIINANIYKGMGAKLRFVGWKKC